MTKKIQSEDYLDFYNSEEYAKKRIEKMRGVLGNKHIKNKRYHDYNLYYYNFTKPHKGEKILDVGCGVGSYVHWAALQGADVHGIDFSSSTLAQAKKHFKGTFVVGNIKHMPFKDNIFDKVFSDEVIEHLTISEGKEMISEIRRVLKPGGTFVIKTPNRNSNFGYRIFQMFYLFLFKGKLQFKGKHDKYHLHEYTKGEAKRMFPGFVVKILEHTYIPGHPIITALFNIWPFRKVMGIKLIMLGKKR